MCLFPMSDSGAAACNMNRRCTGHVTLCTLLYCLQSASMSLLTMAAYTTADQCLRFTHSLPGGLVSGLGGAYQPTVHPGLRRPAGELS
jgi:hypothetical protein